MPVCRAVSAGRLPRGRGGVLIPLVAWIVVAQTIYDITVQGPAGTDPQLLEMMWHQRATSQLLVITAEYS